jgi:hypothetical protein
MYWIPRSSRGMTGKEGRGREDGRGRDGRGREGRGREGRGREGRGITTKSVIPRLDRGIQRLNHRLKKQSESCGEGGNYG